MLSARHVLGGEIEVELEWIKKYRNSALRCVVVAVTVGLQKDANLRWK